MIWAGAFQVVQPSRVILAAALLALTAAAAANATPQDDCNQTQDPDLRVRGCTVIINAVAGVAQWDRAAALTNRGNAYLQLGEINKGVADHRRAVELGPDASRWSNLGGALARAGDLDGAVAALEEAVALDDGWADAWHNLGIINLSRGDLPTARAQFTAALDADPNVNGSLMARMRVNCTLGFADEAYTDMLALIETGEIAVAGLEAGMIQNGLLPGPATGQQSLAFLAALDAMITQDCKR